LIVTDSIEIANLILVSVMTASFWKWLISAE